MFQYSGYSYTWLTGTFLARFGLELSAQFELKKLIQEKEFLK